MISLDCQFLSDLTSGSIFSLGEQGVSVSIPTIATPGKVLTVKITDTVSLQCHAMGLPVPEITWFRVYGTLPSGRHVTHDNGTLIITDTQLTDAGMYVCQAMNALGKAKSTTMLIVHGMKYVVFVMNVIVTSFASKVSLEWTKSTSLSPTVTTKQLSQNMNSLYPYLL